MIGFRAVNKNVLGTPISDINMTSETNQFKIHKTGVFVATSDNQIFTIEHGLSYVPAFCVFKKIAANAYYQLVGQGGSNYIDKNTLSIQLNTTNDIGVYIIFKDFGA